MSYLIQAILTMNAMIWVFNGTLFLTLDYKRLMVLSYTVAVLSAVSAVMNGGK
jgi:hypothetical protein